MRKVGMFAGALLGALALLIPGSASAALDLDMGFEPTAACPGETAQFFFLLENVGGEDQVVTFSVTLTFGDMVFGPFEGDFPLAAGEDISTELAFRIPMGVPPGLLTIDASATDADGTVEAQAQFEVLDCEGKAGGDKAHPNAEKKMLQGIAKELRRIGLK